MIYSLLDKYPEALQDYLKAIEIKPSADLYNKIGMVKYLLKDYVGAIAEFDKAINFDSSFILAVKNKNIIKAKLNSIEATKATKQHKQKKYTTTRSRARTVEISITPQKTIYKINLH